MSETLNINWKCALCGLVYDPNKLAQVSCGSDDGVGGPSGIDDAGRRYVKCVLAVNPIVGKAEKPKPPTLIKLKKGRVK